MDAGVAVSAAVLTLCCIDSDQSRDTRGIVTEDVMPCAALQTLLDPTVQ